MLRSRAFVGLFEVVAVMAACSRFFHCRAPRTKRSSGNTRVRFVHLDSSQSRSALSQFERRNVQSAHVPTQCSVCTDK